MTKSVIERLLGRWFDKGGESKASSEVERVQIVKRKYEAELLQMPNVVAVGVGFKSIKGEIRDQMAIVVNVEQKINKVELTEQALLPEMLEGVPVDVVEVGRLNAL